MIIGERLRAVRRQMKLSLRDVEKRTELLPSNLSRLEKNRSVPSLETLERLAVGLKVPLHRFFYTGIKVPTAQHRNGHRGSWSPKQETRYLNKLLRLFDRLDEFDRRLLLSTAHEMARRRPTARDRR
jgi:transcriptional regulator with XRE-family HTH domain